MMHKATDPLAGVSPEAPKTLTCTVAPFNPGRRIGGCAIEWRPLGACWIWAFAVLACPGALWCLPELASGRALAIDPLGQLAAVVSGLLRDLAPDVAQVAQPPAAVGALDISATARLERHAGPGGVAVGTRIMDLDHASDPSVSRMSEKVLIHAAADAHQLGGMRIKEQFRRVPG
jgi:hypothetical protein